MKVSKLEYAIYGFLAGFIFGLRFYEWLIR